MQHTYDGESTCGSYGVCVHISSHGVQVVLMWVPPHHSAWHVHQMHEAHITMWPMYSASIPSVVVVEALHTVDTVPPTQLCLQIMHA